MLSVRNNLVSLNQIFKVNFFTAINILSNMIYIYINIFPNAVGIGFSERSCIVGSLFRLEVDNLHDDMCPLNFVEF